MTEDEHTKQEEKQADLELPEQQADAVKGGVEWTMPEKVRKTRHHRGKAAKGHKGHGG